jgi:uncharacterized membrane protein
MLIEQFLRVYKREETNQESKGSSLKKSLMKTVSWRVIGTLDTVLISYMITGTVVYALSIGGAELFSKMGLYFLHERLWNRF